MFSPEATGWQGSQGHGEGLVLCRAAFPPLPGPHGLSEAFPAIVQSRGRLRKLRFPGGA